MTLRSKKEYLQITRQRYISANKTAKATILDEFCATCTYNRKYAIRLLNASKKKHCRKPRRPGPKTLYKPKQLLQHLKRMWFATDQMCSKKLKAAIPLWLPFYEQEFGTLDDFIKAKLYVMSPATIDRMLKPIRSQYKKGRCGTKPGTLLKNQIPIQTQCWETSQPGFLEADSVAHCGNSLAGDFLWSLTFTDIATAWTENRAVWNKGAHGVFTQVKDVETCLPFDIRGFDCDNGSEFLNHHLLRYFTNRPSRPVTFTRSRPYHKNDNAHVEQKNWSHVRQLLGYDRFDNPRLVDLLNDLYKNEWSLYNNFFCPSLKLKSKHRINSKYVKKYETPKTPYQRVMASEFVSKEAKQKLAETLLLLNPFALKKNIEAKLKLIFNTLRKPAL